MSNITISNQASKIYIYNSGDESDKHTEPANSFCDLTIHTSFNVTIPNTYSHIRIKNNFKSEASENEKNGSKEIVKKCQFDENFQVNEDVLMKGLDEKFYLGTVIAAKNGKLFLVKFDDNSEKWCPPQKLQKFNSSVTKSEDDEPLCVVCKEKSENDLVEVCDKCSRGYHHKCISQSSLSFLSPWCCDRCSSQEIINISDSEDNDNESDVKMQITGFPYDLTSLHWDVNHKENKEQKYCYCGGPGSWKNKMIQCCKCQQWFHQNCIKSWKGYLMHGDTFFMFCCYICNGSEFIERLELNWENIVHLALFDLSVARNQKYYSISKDVSTFIWENWNKLNFPSSLKLTSKEKLTKKISQTFKKEDRFKVFGGNVNMRRRVPAVPIKIDFPENQTVNEKTIKRANIKTYPLNDEINNDLDIPKENDQRNKNDKHQRCYEDSSDENSSKSALDWIIPPPSNFHGRNNPFHSQYKPNTKFADFSTRKGSKPITDKPPEVRIVRTFKRRLSANEIAMNSNRDSKRRKFSKRRNMGDVEIISEIIQPFTMPLPLLPVRRDSNIANQFINDNFQVPKNENKNVNGAAEKVMNSPVKNNSINMYFGAFNRLENGENFQILAKRLTFDGKEQFLLEWTSKAEMTARE